jgi:hypothetical protein
MRLKSKPLRYYYMVMYWKIAAGRLKGMRGYVVAVITLCVLDTLPCYPRSFAYWDIVLSNRIALREVCVLKTLDIRFFSLRAALLRRCVVGGTVRDVEGDRIGCASRRRVRQPQNSSVMYLGLLVVIVPRSITLQSQR